MYQPNASATNDEDWQIAFVVEDEAGAAQSIYDFNFEFSMRDEDGCAVVQYTLLAVGLDTTEIYRGETEEGDEYLSIFVPASRLRGLDPGSYSIAVRCTRADTGGTKQLLNGKLQIREGGF